MPETVSKSSPPKTGALRWLVREALGNLILVALLFGLAGTTSWPMAWAFAAIYLIWSAATTYFILPKNPEMLAERSRPAAGSKGWDLAILTVFGLLTLAEYLVAGFDFRYGWTQNFPLWLQVAGLLVVFVGYDLLLVWAMVENAFFVAVVRIQEDRGHKVVSTGPYAYVRHPGYLATILFHIGTPFLLNSSWALIPAALAVVTLIIRTALEDRTLQEELTGYKEYAANVRYRLLPSVW